MDFSRFAFSNRLAATTRFSRTIFLPRTPIGIREYDEEGTPGRDDAPCQDGGHYFLGLEFFFHSPRFFHLFPEKMAHTIYRVELFRVAFFRHRSRRVFSARQLYFSIIFPTSRGECMVICLLLLV